MDRQQTSPKLQVGSWYRWGKWPPGYAGRPIRITEHCGGRVYRGRWPSGSERVLHEAQVAEAVPEDELPVPGVSERCVICWGKRMVVVLEPTGTPGVSVVVGAKPCPNCRRRDVTPGA